MRLGAFRSKLDNTYCIIIFTEIHGINHITNRCGAVNNLYEILLTEQSQLIETTELKIELLVLPNARRHLSDIPKDYWFFNWMSFGI